MIEDYSFGARREVFQPLLGDGIFTQDGPSWWHSRDLLRKQLARTKYQDLEQFREHVDNLLALLPKSGTIDLQPLFFDLTLDTTTALILGHSIQSLRAEKGASAREFAEAFSTAQEGLSTRLRIAPWHNLYNPANFRRACSKVHEIVDQYVHDSDSSRSASFVGQLKEEFDGNPRAVRDQLLNILLAGRDTTACCLAWTMWLLVRYPQAMQRLRGEIVTVIGKDHPTRAQIRKLPYLDCAIKESLRLFPPVPLNSRQAVRDTILPTGGGPKGDSPILVRKGEVTVISQYVNSRRKNIYGADCDEFHPERWETAEMSSIKWAYFPFSGGPRTCLGQDFALMELSYTIVRMLQSYTFELPESEHAGPVGTERQRLTLVLSIADGCNVRVKRTAEADSHF